MKKREINTIFASISALLLVFGLIYGLFFFNIGKNKKANSDMEESEITSADKKDKDVDYKVKEVEIDAISYSLVANKYIEKANMDNTYSYMNLSNTKLIVKNSSRMEVGYDGVLYDVTYDDNTLTISFAKNGLMIPAYSVLKTSNFFSKVYYVKDNYFYLLGVVLESDNVDYFYYINGDTTVKEIVLENNHFLGDNFFDEIGCITTSDLRYIVISSIGHNSSKNPKVFDLVDEKIVLDNKYEDIISIGDSMFIASNDNKSSIINSSGKSLTIPCDFIDRIDDYYLMTRDKKMAILDNNKKVITDFEIPYYGDAQSYHTLFNTSYTGLTYNDKLVVIPYDAASGKADVVYYLNKDNKLSKLNDENVYFDNFIYSYSESNNSLNVYTDSFELAYIININDYFEGFTLYDLEFKKYGDTLVLSKNDSKYYFDYKTGEKIDGVKDYVIKYTDSISIKVHSLLSEGQNRNVFSVVINDKEYAEYNHADFDFTGVFKKIGEKYYILGDNKYLIISKG